MDIENGTWVQLKSDTSKVYCVNSVSDENLLKAYHQMEKELP